MRWARMRRAICPLQHPQPLQVLSDERYECALPALRNSVVRQFGHDGVRIVLALQRANEKVGCAYRLSALRVANLAGEKLGDILHHDKLRLQLLGNLSDHDYQQVPVILRACVSIALLASTRPRTAHALARRARAEQRRPPTAGSVELWLDDLAPRFSQGARDP